MAQKTLDMTFPMEELDSMMTPTYKEVLTQERTYGICWDGNTGCSKLGLNDGASQAWPTSPSWRTKAHSLCLCKLPPMDKTISRELPQIRCLWLAVHHGLLLRPGTQSWPRYKPLSTKPLKREHRFPAPQHNDTADADMSILNYLVLFLQGGVWPALLLFSSCDTAGLIVNTAWKPAQQRRGVENSERHDIGWHRITWMSDLSDTFVGGSRARAPPANTLMAFPLDSEHVLTCSSETAQFHATEPQSPQSGVPCL
ncbi:hypothetical protein NFI96_010240 [Prochilodus magdalenae]|nr:hypothetical protein NFI96_010240 [Prochilodus magdalenae]